jgi:hypothetical protein
VLFVSPRFRGGDKGWGKGGHKENWRNLFRVGQPFLVIDFMIEKLSGSPGVFEQLLSKLAKGKNFTFLLRFGATKPMK